jgi:hypothetical protein
MVDEDVLKTIVITKTRFFKWNVMPFILKNKTSTFSRTMAKIFKEWTDQFLKIVVDDVNVHNSDWSEHLENLRLVFERPRFVNLKLNPRKCCVGVWEIVFLGHVVNEHGSRPYPTKVCVVSNSFIHHECAGLFGVPWILQNIYPRVYYNCWSLI